MTIQKTLVSALTVYKAESKMSKPNFPKKTVGAGYLPSKDQDVKASKVRVGTVRCRRLMVNENEALEAVVDEVDDDIDPIPKDEHNSYKLEAWEDLCHRRRYTKVHAKGPKAEQKTVQEPLHHRSERSQCW